MSETKEYELEIKIGDNQKSIMSYNTEILNFIKNNCSSFNCYIKTVYYQSKYNSCVFYDYEPFCPDGFYIKVKLASSNDYNLYAFKHYYDSKISTLEYLDRCYNMECYKKEINSNIKLDIEKHFG